MTALGTLTLTTFRNQPDQIDYAFADNSISAPHLLALRRQISAPKADDKGSMRVNLRVSKMVQVDASGIKKELQFNVTGVVPIGVDPAVVEAMYTDELLVAANAAPTKLLMKSGDINLAD